MAEELLREGSEQQAEKKDVLIHKCGKCGSDLEYDSTQKLLVCNHCGNTEKIQGQMSEEIVFTELPVEEQTDLQNKLHSFRCKNCGATITFDNYAISGECPFCGATSIMEREEIAGLAPNGIVPFKLTEEQASVYYKKWIKRKLFAPRKLKKSIKADSMQGVYIPVFTFDSAVSSYYKGRLGERRTRTVTRNGKTHTETYIYWFTVKGLLNTGYDDLVIEASDRINQVEIDALTPFDTNHAKEYDSAYITGYLALNNDTSVRSCWETAKNKIAKDVEQKIMSRYNADVVDYLNVDSYYDRTSYKYILVPIWFATYKFKSKLYRFLVNAVSGKTTGKAPISPGKVSIVVFLGLCLLAGIAYLILKYNGII